jgi:hypothetical protein
VEKNSGRRQVMVISNGEAVVGDEAQVPRWVARAGISGARMLVENPDVLDHALDAGEIGDHAIAGTRLFKATSVRRRGATSFTTLYIGNIVLDVQVALRALDENDGE